MYDESCSFIHACPSLSSSTLHLFHSSVIYFSDSLSNRFPFSSLLSLSCLSFSLIIALLASLVPPQPSLVCLDGRCRNPQKGVLKLSILNATIINDVTDATYDSLVKVFTFGGNLVRTSNVIKNSNSPAWKSSFGLAEFMTDEPIVFKVLARGATGDDVLFSHEVTVSQFKSIKGPVTSISSGPTCQAFTEEEFAQFSRFCYELTWTSNSLI